MPEHDDLAGRIELEDALHDLPLHAVPEKAPGHSEGRQGQDANWRITRLLRELGRPARVLLPDGEAAAAEALCPSQHNVSASAKGQVLARLGERLPAEVGDGREVGRESTEAQVGIGPDRPGRKGGDEPLEDRASPGSVTGRRVVVRGGEAAAQLGLGLFSGRQATGLLGELGGPVGSTPGCGPCRGLLERGRDGLLRCLGAEG